MKTNKNVVFNIYGEGVMEKYLKRLLKKNDVPWMAK